MHENMAKVIVLLFIFFSFGNALQHLGTHFKKGTSDPAVHEFLHKQTHKSAVKKCPQFEHKIKNATHEAEKCIGNNFDPVHQNLCSFIEAKFKPCVEPMTSLLEHCLPEKSKDVPRFIVNTAVSMVEYVCQAKGFELLELTQPCIAHSLSDEEENPCWDELKAEMTLYETDFPTKADICNLLAAQENCQKKLLAKHCTSTITRNIYFKFYKVLSKHCN